MPLLGKEYRSFLSAGMSISGAWAPLGRDFCACLQAVLLQKKAHPEVRP